MVSKYNYKQDQKRTITVHQLSLHIWPLQIHITDRSGLENTSRQQIYWSAWASLTIHCNVCMFQCSNSNHSTVASQIPNYIQISENSMLNQTLRYSISLRHKQPLASKISPVVLNYKRGRTTCKYILAEDWCQLAQTLATSQNKMSGISMQHTLYICCATELDNMATAASTVDINPWHQWQ